MFGNLATGHFQEKKFSRYTPTGLTGSNDTGLKTLALPGAESIEGQTDILGYYNIDVQLVKEKSHQR